MIRTPAAMKNVLVVYYSRSGYTQRVAERLARALDADLEAIRERHGRRGLLGFLRSAVDAMTHREPVIAAPVHDPARYRRVVIGSPVWEASVSAPVRSYLKQHGGRIRRAALFCTCGSSGAEEALAEMAALLQIDEVETLDLHACPTLWLSDAQIDADERERLDAFVTAIRRRRPAPGEAAAARR